VISSHKRWFFGLLAASVVGCAAEAADPPVPAGGDALAVVASAAFAGSGGALPPAEAVIPETPPHFERPEHIRGLYLNAWAAGSTRKMEQMIALARATEVNSFVIDLKDASGYVSHATEVELARLSGATGQRRIRDLTALLRRLEQENIYPIARIVIVQDPVLIAARPALAVQDTSGGVWVDSKGIRWLDPYNKEVWDYHVALAREAARLGFPEIQWDYVRFPDAPRSDMARAVFTASDGRERSQVIRGFLSYAREQLQDTNVRMTADVFGITTTTRDVGIGQVWEHFIDQLDAALPMVYPSHYYVKSFGYDRPNAYPYEVVKGALQRALARSSAVPGAGQIIPWLQDFTLGEPAYGPAEVRAQMQAAYDVGIQDWILWNASSRYTEAALEPEGGFGEEPQIRVGGRVVPVSERHEVLAPTAASDTTGVAPE
jgi:hypothetical protein